MQCIDRYEKYNDENFDTIILKIKNGTIKCGKYANMVKIDKNKTLKGKEFFNGRNGDKSERRKRSEVVERDREETKE